jgi:preprotein translocase subunit SecY
VAFWLRSQTSPGGAPLVPPHIQDALWGLGFPIMTVLTLTTGTAFIMWLGEQISERGIGNGISLIIFAGIVVGLPVGGPPPSATSARRAQTSSRCCSSWLFMVAVDAVRGLMERAQRRIPVQYAKRVVGPQGLRRLEHVPPAAREHRRRHPGHLRLVDPGDPADDRARWIKQPWGPAIGTQLAMASRCTTCSSRRHHLLRLLLHVDRLQSGRHGRQHAQVRRLHPRHPPGQEDVGLHRPRADAHHLRGALVPGAGLLIPEFLISGVPRRAAAVRHRRELDRILPLWITEGMGLNFYFGGTSLLIVVGVAMDTMQQIESQWSCATTTGFMKKGASRSAAVE